MSVVEVVRYRLGDGWCPATPRPCAALTCRMNLVAARMRQADRWACAPRTDATDGWSCALDFSRANPDGGTLQEVGDAFGLTRERVRQIETRALTRLFRQAKALLAAETVRP